MKPGTPSDKPIDTGEIKSLTPVDDLQATKEYGRRENFTDWQLPDPLRPGKAGTFSGHMQQMFCNYRTDTGRLVRGEWWCMNIAGRGSMNDNVAPGYQLVRNPKTHAYEPKLVPINLEQFSQFWPAD